MGPRHVPRQSLPPHPLSFAPFRVRLNADNHVFVPPARQTQDDMYHTRHSATLNQTVSQLASNPLSVERKAFVHTRLSSFLSSILLNWPLSTSQPSNVILDPDNPPPSPPSMASLKSRLQIRTVPMTPQHYDHPWLTPASRINEYSNLVESVAREVGVEVSPWAEVLEEAEEWGGGGKGGRWLDHIHRQFCPAHFHFKHELTDMRLIGFSPTTSRTGPCIGLVD
jgi:hypothetical protein